MIPKAAARRLLNHPTNVAKHGLNIADEPIPLYDGLGEEELDSTRLPGMSSSPKM